jgi:hypothetical protein
MRYGFIILASATMLTGCATAQEMRTKPANLSFSVKVADIQRFASCLQDGLQIKEGGQFAITNTTDPQGITHLTANIPGVTDLYEWDVALVRVEPGLARVERRSNRTVWGGVIGARDIETISADCTN